MRVINPATEEIIAEIASDDRGTLQGKLKELREGQIQWRQKSVIERLACIVRFGELVQENITMLPQSREVLFPVPLSWKAKLFLLPL